MERENKKADLRLLFLFATKQAEPVRDYFWAGFVPFFAGFCFFAMTQYSFRD
jgi:hypothetical protein